MTRAELLEQIATVAREMRAAQSAYFAAARSNAFRGNELRTARQLEARLDGLLAQLDAPEPAQRNLF